MQKSNNLAIQILKLLNIPHQNVASMSINFQTDGCPFVNITRLIDYEEVKEIYHLTEESNLQQTSNIIVNWIKESIEEK